MKHSILIIVFFLSACSLNDNSNSTNILNFSDVMTYEEFKMKLDIYSKNNKYPDIDD